MVFFELKTIYVLYNHLKISAYQVHYDKNATDWFVRFRIEIWNNYVMNIGCENIILNWRKFPKNIYFAQLSFSTVLVLKQIFHQFYCNNLPGRYVNGFHHLAKGAATKEFHNFILIWFNFAPCIVDFTGIAVAILRLHF